MAWPDANQSILTFWGGSGGYEQDNLLAYIDAASGLPYGVNPLYTPADFLAFYPKFNGLVPAPVIAAYVLAATSSLSVQMWGATSWPIAIGLYVAHFCTLYLQTDGTAAPTAAIAAQQGFTRGVQVSKSADGLSTSYQHITGLAEWGAFNLTMYGLQLVTMAQFIGSGPMLIY